MSGTVSTPALSVANVTAAPSSTVLGVLALLQGAQGVIASGAMPTTSMGWASLGIGFLASVLGAFSK